MAAFAFEGTAWLLDPEPPAASNPSKHHFMDTVALFAANDQCRVNTPML
jgi:hypothetical protein